MLSPVHASTDTNVGWHLESDSPLVAPTLEELVVQRLTVQILDGTLEPGTRLDQTEIAHTLGVSRTPVRDALRRLGMTGLVHVVPGRGAIVAELTYEDIVEIYSVRSSLEGMAGRQAALGLSEENLTTLATILDRMEDIEDTRAWTVANQEFHHLIYVGASRPRLLQLIDQLRDLCSPYVRWHLMSADSKRLARSDHRAILAALEARDGSAAELEIRTHLNRVCEGLADVL
ncbi:MAG: GntR family transcriptional regulator [Chloroflexota bacterium]